MAAVGANVVLRLRLKVRDAGERSCTRGVGRVKRELRHTIEAHGVQTALQTFCNV